MSNDFVTARLPLKIVITGGIVQSIVDADGHAIEAEVMDYDTGSLDADHPDLKTDQDGDDYLYYMP
jgi:hypothetical protein